jgi:hypothetical protein
MAVSEMQTGRRPASGTQRAAARTDGMAEPQTITWDTDDRLAADVYCVSCGYNLRGLKRSGPCGECGVPIKYSLTGSRLSYADPAWINRLRAGTACLALSLPWLWFPPAWLLFSYGLWCVSAPDPAQARRGTAVQTTVVRALFAGLPCMVMYGAVPLCAAYWFANAAALKFDPTEATLFLLGGVLLLVPPLATAATWRIVVRGGSRRLKHCYGAAFWLGVASLLCVAGWGVDSLVRLRIDVLIAFGAIGVPLGVFAFVFLGVCLYGTWRNLERAEAQARALRSEIRYWQRLVPGSTGVGGV